MVPVRPCCFTLTVVSLVVRAVHGQRVRHRRSISPRQEPGRSRVSAEGSGGPTNPLQPAALSADALRTLLMLSRLLLPPSAAVLRRTQKQSESGSMVLDDTGSLAVSVCVWSVGGAAPAPGTPPKPTPTAEALPNVTVRVRQADGTDLEQVTDDQGQTTFDLAAGEYLAYLPVDAQTQPALQYASSGPTEPWPGTGQPQKSTPRRQAGSPSKSCSNFRQFTYRTGVSYHFPDDANEEPRICGCTRPLLRWPG
jgi:hypothetical protein